MTCAIISNGNELKNDLKDENELRIVKLKEKLKQHILILYTIGHDSFYLDCEYGIPLWAAEIICEIKNSRSIKLHIIMPYEEQATKWSEDIRNRYFTVHEKADSVEMISTKYQIGCYAMAEDMMLRKCYRVLFCQNCEDKRFPDYLDEYDARRTFLYY